MRRFLYGLVTAALCIAAGLTSAHAQPSPSPSVSSAAVERFALRPPVQLPAVRAAIPSYPQPQSSHHFTESLGLLAAVGAIKKRATRRSSGKRGVPMYLDSEVHVMRESDDPDKKGKLVTTVIKGGVLVDDTDLTDDEIDELTARRVIRPATMDEIDRLERADTAVARAELVAQQQDEVAQLRASNEQARAALAAKDNVSGETLAKADQKAAMDVAALQEKHAAVLAKFDAKQS